MQGCFDEDITIIREVERATPTSLNHYWLLDPDAPLSLIQQTFTTHDFLCVYSRTLKAWMKIAQLN